MVVLRRVSESVKDYDTIRYTTCDNMCESGCGMKVYLKDGRIVDIWGDDEHPQNYGSLCPKGTANYQHAYNPLRAKYPVIREDNVNGKFRRVTWDEALDFVADRLKYIREKWGAHTVACHRTGRSSYGNKLGGSRFLAMYGTPNIYGQGPLCCESPGARGQYVFGAKEFLRLMNPCQDAMNSDTIFISGANAAALEVITMKWFIEAQDRNGAKMIVIDPRFNATMAKADLALRLRPTTDAYLANALAHVLIYEIDGIDKDFIARWTVGFEKYKELVKDYTPEKAENITWVPAEDIRKAAEWIAYPRRTHFTGCLGTAQQYNAGNGNAAYQILVAITGNVGVKGGGWNWLHNCRPVLSAGKDLKEYVAKIKEPQLADKIIPWGDTSSACTINPGYTGKPYPVKGLIWNGNHAVQWPNNNKVREYMKNLYCGVHLSFHPNETMSWMHAAFPITSFFEHEGVVHHGNNRHVQWHNQIIERQWECRADIDFWAGLAKRFEFAEAYYAPDGKSWWAKKDVFGNPLPEDPKYPGTTHEIDERVCQNWFHSQEPFVAGITVELMDPEMSPKGGVMWPAETKDEAMMYSDPEATIRGAQWIMYKEGVNYPGTDKRFPTPSGKVEIYSQALEQIGWYPLPIHIEPSNAPVARPDLWEKYPLILCTGRLVAHFHEMGHWWPWMVELEPHRFINIHTELAKALGIRDGDTVVCENDYGKVIGPAWVNEMVDEGEVWGPEGFDKYQPFYPYSNINELVDDTVKDPFYTQAQYKCNLVRVYRLGDDPDKAVEKTKEFLAKVKRTPKDYLDPEKEPTVNLGTYTRFIQKGSGIYYVGVPREKWETK
ncbi:MAG: molybdopterin-dependent oxidoreductase [Euryarchaeota archaeon]|nr:molybdopterin-dependent oxidoreductase [Euryarchaeota archaeon]